MIYKTRRRVVPSLVDVTKSHREVYIYMSIAGKTRPVNIAEAEVQLEFIANRQSRFALPVYIRAARV